MSEDEERYEWRIVGEGITERRKRVWKPGTKRQSQGTLLDRMRRIADNNNAFWRDPWAPNREMHDGICAEYDELREKLGPEQLHIELSEANERKSLAWWLREMARAGNLAKDAIERNDAGAAAYWAFEFGETVAEYNIALARGWNRYAVAGKKVVEGAQSTRKGARLARVAEIERLISVGTKVTAAFAIVAEAEGVTPKAIETDYYKARRKAS